MSPEMLQQLRRAAEKAKRSEFLALILDIDTVDFDAAQMVAEHMAKVAALKLFPDTDLDE